MNVAELKTAADVIHAGGIVAYPTESCYGLGCDPRQQRAVRRLLHIKRRQWQQGLILIAARLPQVLRYINCDQPHVLDRALGTWPGPTTWLMPPKSGVSRWLTGTYRSLAVRVTAHRGAAALCSYSRLALVSTSANRHGRPPARSAGAVYREFGGEVDYILVGRLGGQENPSEIRDAISNAVVRPA